MSNARAEHRRQGRVDAKKPSGAAIVLPVALRNRDEATVRRAIADAERDDLLPVPGTKLVARVTSVSGGLIIMSELGFDDGAVRFMGRECEDFGDDAVIAFISREVAR